MLMLPTPFAVWEHCGFWILDFEVTEGSVTQMIYVKVKKD